MAIFDRVKKVWNANAKSVQQTGRAIAEDVKDEVQDISEEIGKKAAETVADLEKRTIMAVKTATKKVVKKTAAKKPAAKKATLGSADAICIHF